VPARSLNPLAFAIFAVVAGRVLLAVTHPESLRSIIRGWVAKSWAARHASAWLAEEQSEEQSKVDLDTLR
jgi:cytochrome b subunit of formate dehydrogenase